jgi:hypothetical protein
MLFILLLQRKENRGFVAESPGFPTLVLLCLFNNFEMNFEPAGTNSSQDTIWKKPFSKRAGGVAQSEGPEFKPQYHKKKKKEMRKEMNLIILKCKMLRYPKVFKC